MSRIAVAGGTGVVGREVVSAVESAGHDPVVLSRSTGVDVLAGGRGLTAALEGVDAVIDVLNAATTSRARSERFFETTTRHLLEAERAAGVGHHVVLSIVGIDRVDFGYYVGKRRQEEVALAGDVPVSILRATQFHEFAGQLLDRMRGPVVLVPKMLSQPVAAREVADALVSLALGTPAGRAPDLAGPEVLAMPDLVRRVRNARGSRRAVLSVRLPGKVGKAMTDGGLLPLEDGPRGTRTFADWLSG